VNQEDIIKIANVNNHINAINKLNQGFIEHVRDSPQPDNIPSQLKIDGQKIVISCFGYTAEASSRIVKNKDDSLSVEYIFIVKLGEETFEVWRFYLTSSGRIALGLDTEATACDYNNDKVVNYLCSELLIGALESPLFSPTPKI